MSIEALMRLSVPVVLSLLLLGSCLPDEREAAVGLEVTYKARPGCIIVLARDAKEPHGEASTHLDGDKLDNKRARIAIFRQESWSHTLEIIITAHEQSCEGPEVARNERQIRLSSSGVEPISVTLDVTDEDGDGYMPVSLNGTPGGTDCNDEQSNTHPNATEVCDDQDNDCNGTPDDGEGARSWYPDQDGDSYGDMLASPVESCAAPAGPPAYVQDATDCQDSDPQIYPNPGTFEARCDDVDDDCDGIIDDGFTNKGAECSDPCPTGRFRCTPSGDGLFCDAPAKEPVFQDKDADGAGNEAAPSMGEACRNEVLPPGSVFNTDDCDDLDPHNWRGRAEVCDDRDNTCDGVRDEGDVCGGKGWARINDPAIEENDPDWRTVALGSGGLPVWVAGRGGVLAVRFNPGESFVSRNGNCDSRNWSAAWVRPSDGHVFLAGEDGYLAEHDGTDCLNEDRVASPYNDLTGLVGFESNGTTELYVVDALGRLYVWTPGSPPRERYNTDPPTYFGIHGVQSNLLLVVGGTSGNNQAPHIVSYPGSGGAEAVRPHTLREIPEGYVGEVRAVWMAPTGLAYAVGDRGLVMRWDGVEGWDRVLPSAATAIANFTSVVVLDSSSIYVTDTDGNIRRLTEGGGAEYPFYNTDKPLRDIALNSPADIWAVGDDGRVIHFPE